LAKSWDALFHRSGQKAKGKKQADSADKKPVLLSEPPGIGKTMAAIVVSQMLGLQANEVFFFSICAIYSPFYFTGLNSNNDFL
jgi:hypothetical protein